MDLDKIKNFFIFHIEKMIVAVVVAASGFLVYQGLQQPNILEKIQPEKLTADAQQVRAALDENHNDAIIPDRIPNFSIVKRADDTLSKVNPAPYKLRTTWDVVESSGLSRRNDPVLFAPRAVQAQGVITTLAMRSGSGEYMLKDLLPADPVEPVEVVKKPSRREQRQAAMYGEEEEYEEEYDMEEMFDPALLDPSMAGQTGPIRKFLAENDFGMRPGPTKNIQNDATQLPVPALGWFIAGTAIVPHKLIHESYEHALKDADGYDYMRRDRPIYRDFQLQRADVTDKRIDELVEEDWVKRDGRYEVTVDAAVYWSGFATELIPDDYRDDALTMWIPPVLLDDYSKWVLHPQIPMMSKDEIDAIDGAVVIEDTEVDVDQFILETEARAREAETTGLNITFDTGYYGMGPVDPVDHKMVRFYDFATDPRRDANAPKPGRKYVYRVRVALDDPNFPSDPILQPKEKTLSAEAYRRVAGLINRAREEKKRSYKLWTDWSEPSDPATLPGRGKHLVGKVEAKAARPVEVGNRTVQFERDPPSAKMVISEYSPEVQTRIPMLVDVTEGSVLSHEEEFADVIDPITYEIRKYQHLDEEGEPIEDTTVGVTSGATIVDIEGGARLAIQSEDEMTEPGYMLIFDPLGGLKVHSDIEDQRDYRIYSFADERGE